jgi:hypothetical protein
MMSRSSIIVSLRLLRRFRSTFWRWVERANQETPGPTTVIMSFFFTIVKYNILELSKCSGTTRPAGRTMGGAASGWSRAARDVYEPCTGSCVEPEGARRRSVGNFLVSSPISFLRRANRCCAGLSFRQIGPPGAPSWRPTARMGTFREGMAMRVTARLAPTVRRQTRLGACVMKDLEEMLERLFQTAWSLRPSPARNQVFRELEQFRLQIDALRKRTELPERKDASG